MVAEKRKPCKAARARTLLPRSTRVCPPRSPRVSWPTRRIQSRARCLAAWWFGVSVTPRWLLTECWRMPCEWVRQRGKWCGKQHCSSSPALHAALASGVIMLQLRRADSGPLQSDSGEGAAAKSANATTETTGGMPADLTLDLELNNDFVCMLAQSFYFLVSAAY